MKKIKYFTLIGLLIISIGICLYSLISINTIENLSQVNEELKISSINNRIHKSPDFNSRVQYDEFVFLSKKLNLTNLFITKKISDVEYQTNLNDIDKQIEINNNHINKLLELKEKNEDIRNENHIKILICVCFFIISFFLSIIMSDKKQQK